MLGNFFNHVSYFERGGKIESLDSLKCRVVYEEKANASGKSTREKGIGLKVFSYYFSLSSSSIYIERPCF